MVRSGASLLGVSMADRVIDLAREAVASMESTDWSPTEFGSARSWSTNARLFALFEHAPVAISVLEGPEHRYVVANALMRRVIGNRPYVGKSVRAVIPELDGHGVLD